MGNEEINYAQLFDEVVVSAKTIAEMTTAVYRQVERAMLEQGADEEFAKAVAAETALGALRRGYSE